MPGVGGGGHGGGGGFGGGGFGGGHGGGGGFGGGGDFGGGPGGFGPGGFGPGGWHHGPPPPHHHWWGWGPGYFWGPGYYYGGFGGMLVGILVTPIILLIFAATILAITLTTSLGTALSGGQIHYDNPQRVETYGLNAYNSVFYEDAEGYEDGLLVMFFTYDDAFNYDYYVINGNHVATSVVNEMTSYSTLGNYLDATYTARLDYSLAKFLDQKAQNIVALNLSSPFDRFCTDNNHNQSVTTVTNQTSLKFSNLTTLETVCSDFTKQTGITVSVWVDEAADVFGVDYSSMIGGIVASSLLIVAAIVIVVSGVVKMNKYKKQPPNGQGGNTNGQGGGNGGSTSGSTYTGRRYSDNDTFFNG